jgi:hypothetical protein
VTLTVFKYSPAWPFPRTGYLCNPSEIAFSFELMGVGQFQFRLPIDDAQGIAEGELVAIVSQVTAMPTFVGYVERIRSSEAGTHAEVTGREWAGLLEERTTLQERTYTGASGDLAREIVRRASGRNQMGLQVLGNKVSSPVIGPVTVRAQPVIDALALISSLSGWEWQVQYEAGQRVNAIFTWRERVGFDQRQTVHLGANVMIDAEYAADNLQDRQMVQIIGSALGDFASRPSAAVTNDAPIALQDTALLQATSVRNVNQRNVKARGITSSREAVIINPDLPDRLAVARVARDEAVEATLARETISMTVGLAAPWDELMPGNIVTVRLPRARYGVGVIRPFRIYACQPDENEGQLRMVGRVLP